MKVKVILGTVRANNGEFKVGETLNLPEVEANQLITSGAVEEVKEPTPAGKKAEKKAAKEAAEKAKKAEEAKAEEKPEEEAEVEAPAPSMEWTRKELVEAAEVKKIEVPEKATKAEILELLNSQDEGGEEE